MTIKRREVKLATLLTLCSFLLYARQIHGAANIDTIQLIVRYSPDREAEDDYGYAVALHQDKVPTEGDFEDALNSTKIIVGAPMGTYPGGLSVDMDTTPVNMTGLVYTCSVDQGTGCTGLMGNQTNKNDRRLFDGEPDGNVTTVISGGSTIEEPEHKSGQLMGATLQSSGGNFLVCAPRYQTFGTFRVLDNRRPVGRCFISGRELENFVDYRPCRGGNSVVDTFGDSHCLTGIGASLYVDDNNRTLAALGAVGQSSYDGRVFLYDVTEVNNTVIGMSTTTFPSTTSYVYEGYSVASGRITGTSTDFVIGIPRSDGSLYIGGAVVRNVNNFQGVEPGYNLTGETIGEYYGWSVATADLNNDGYDEILVGAPVFSSSKAEVGRVYVYENNRDGTVASPIRLEGQSANARFGTSIVNLGDVNGDGYDDVAIGAPYHNAPDTDNTGAVYIYYGNMNGQIISTTPDQIIDASSVVNRVNGLDELKSFGYSLSSGVDVDNNAYNDLLVGAYQSKTAVLFRTLSVARITVNATVSSGDTIPIEGAATSGTEFTLSVCASYNGRGLTGRPLETNLIVREVGEFDRLLFGGRAEYRNPFQFSTTDNETCQTVIVTIKPLSQQPANVDVTTPYEVIVDFAQFERPLNPTDGNEVLTDLRNVPLLLVDGDRTAMVTPSIRCAEGPTLDECEADLQLSSVGIDYRASETSPPLVNRDSVVANEVRYVDIRLSYTNVGPDPAFGTMLHFIIPEPFARQASVRFDDQQRTNPVKCNPAGGRNLTCGLDNYQAVGQSSAVVVQLNINVPLVGDEDPVMFSASVSVNPVNSVDVDEGNNVIEPVTIGFSAVSDHLINSLTMTGPMNYATSILGSEGTVGNLGRRVNLRTSVTNGGPSTNPLAEVRISFPVGSSSVGPHFYVYDYQSSDAMVDCTATDGFIVNRDNLELSFSSSRRRRDVGRSKRQEAQTQTIQTNVNCSDPTIRASSSCANFVCRVTTFTPKNFVVDINAVVDRRFFDSRSETFVYTSYAVISSETDFVTDPVSSNDNGRFEFSLGPAVDDSSGSFPIWIPIVCAIAALILIIILFVLLYFFGFFRRNRVKDQQAEGDFEIREVPPDAQGAPVPVVGGLAPIDEKGDYIGEEVTPEKEDLHNEIGDASDLQNGEIGESNKEPEETSL